MSRTPSLEQALHWHQSGDYARAEAAYLQLLKHDPQQPDALHLLGLIALQRQDYPLALRQIEAALQQDPENPTFYRNLSQVYLASGQPAQAQNTLRRALLHFPAQVFELTDLRLALQLQLAQLHHQQSQWQASADTCQLALAELPPAGAQAADLVADLAVVAELWHLLAQALFQLQQWAPAQMAAQTALELAPSADIHNTLGNFEVAQGQHASAQAHYQQALALQPDHLLALYNLGRSHEDQRQWLPAQAAYEQFLARAPQQLPQYALAHNQLGNLHKERGEFEAAQQAYDQALAADPDCALAQYNRSLLLLLRGNLAEGFAQYEWRWRSPHYTAPRHTQRPRWQGQPLEAVAGQRLLVHAEQGLGDTLQCCRYLPLLQALGAQLIFECQAPLIPLLQQLPGLSLHASNSPLPDFDLQIPLFSLPGIFYASQGIPAEIPYLTAPPPQRLRLTEPGLKIGLVWAGNPKHRDDARRSCPWEHFAQLLARFPTLQAYSLQTGPRAADAQAETHAETHTLIALGPELQHFADTAEVLGQLDLIISVDTAVVHLAGALGKPVWVLLASVPDWRWGLHSATSVWYPSARLFRQPQAGDWEAVFAELAQALAAWMLAQA